MGLRAENENTSIIKVKEEKPTGKLLKNPLESVRPVKFPAAQVHNYQEVPHQSYHKTKQKSNNGNVHVTTSHLLGSNQQTKSVKGMCSCRTAAA